MFHDADTVQAAAPPATPTRLPPPPKKKKPRRIGLWVFVIVIVALAGGAWGWWHHRNATLAAEKAGAVVTVAAKRASVEKAIESSGTIAANLEVEIKCRASGEITKLPFDISQSVKKGELLCQLDPTDEQLSVRSAQAKLESAQAKLAQAKSTLDEATQNLVTTRTRTQAALDSAKVRATNARSKSDRQKQLIDQKLGSQEEYETAETEAAVAVADERTAEVAVAELKQQEIALENKRQDVVLAESDLQAAQITLDQAKQQLDYTTVAAPIDGTVSSLDVQLGMIVASGTNNVSGGTAIMTLSDLSRVYVLATVDEADIGGVKVGQKARITVDSFAGKVFEGVVERVAVKGVEESNVVTFEVKVEVTDADKALLKPQMTADVAIVEASRRGVLTLPASALQKKDGKPVVKLANGEHKEVEIGIEGNERVEIVSGLNEGDKVVDNTTEQQSRWRTQGAQGSSSSSSSSGRPRGMLR